VLASGILAAIWLGACSSPTRDPEPGPTDAGADVGPVDASDASLDGGDGGRDAGTDGGTSDAGDGGTTLSRGPELTPCPDGWEERIRPSGTTVCVPWPAGSPARLRPCPDGWTPVDVGDGAEVCEPPPAGTVDFTPCPDGWREVTDEHGITTCDPYPPGGAQDCPVGEIHFLGTPGCSRIGTACPTGDLPENLPPGAPVVYVRAGAVGGDGSAAAPYGGFDAFPIDQLPAGTIVAVGKGTYVVNDLDPAGGVTLWGACVADTVLTSTTPESVLGDGVIASSNAFTVRNLQIADAARPAVAVFGQGEASLEDILVVRATASGLFADDQASLTVRRAAVLDTRPVAGSFGTGVQHESFGSLVMEQVVVERSFTFGIVTQSSSILRDVIARDTQPEPLRGIGGNGIAASGPPGTPTTHRLERCLLEGNHEQAIQVLRATPGISVVAEMSQTLIRDTRPGLIDVGVGVLADLGSDVRLDRVTVEGGGAGISAFRGRLEGTNIVVRNPRRVVGASFRSGLGIESALDGQLALTDVVIIEAEDAAVRAESSLELERGLLLGGALGLDIEGGVIRVNEVDVRAGGGPALRLVGSASELRAEDLVIRPLPGTPQVSIRQGSVELSRGWLAGSGSIEVTQRGRAQLRHVGTTSVAAFSVAGDAEVFLSDSHCRMAGPVAVEDQGQLTTFSSRVEAVGATHEGPLLSVAAGAEAELRATDLRSAVGLAIDVRGNGSRLTTEDLVIVDSRPRETDGRAGRAVQASDQALVRLDRTRVDGAFELAVGVFDEGTEILGRDVSVETVRLPPCAAPPNPTCSDEALAHGLGAFRGGRIDLIRSEVVGADRCAVFVGADSGVDLVLSTLRASETAVCINDPGFDATRIADTDQLDNGQATDTNRPEAFPLDPAD
jgi:hypothetical protein